MSYVFIVVSARLAGMDRTLENASADLGANEWTTFRRVILPQVMPGVIGGALLAFIISMDDLVITYFISGVDTQTLPLFIFGMLRRGIKPEINAIAVMMLAFSFGVASLGLYLRGPATADAQAGQSAGSGLRPGRHAGSIQRHHGRAGRSGRPEDDHRGPAACRTAPTGQDRHYRHHAARRRRVSFAGMGRASAASTAMAK